MNSLSPASKKAILDETFAMVGHGKAVHFRNHFVGGEIRTRRLASGLSLRAFAERIAHPVSASTLSLIERGREWPSPGLLAAIVAALPDTPETEEKNPCPI